MGRKLIIAVKFLIRLACGWICRPLQPSTPCPGRGNMWIVQATDEPSMTILQTTHGEVVISRQKTDVQPALSRPSLVGSAKTLALCESKNVPKTGLTTPDADPWSRSDPWGAYKPSVPAPVCTPGDGMLQMEDRIQSAILAKMQSPMEQDDLPDRVHALEGQVQQLLGKQQTFEQQLHDVSGQHTQQLTALQNQVNVQAQQFHGHIENQNQTIQSMFEQQMTQIRTLLAKRPRDDAGQE